MKVLKIKDLDETVGTSAFVAIFKHSFGHLDCSGSNYLPRVLIMTMKM